MTGNYDLWIVSPCLEIAEPFLISSDIKNRGLEVVKTLIQKKEEDNTPPIIFLQHVHDDFPYLGSVSPDKWFTFVLIRRPIELVNLVDIALKPQNY